MTIHVKTRVLAGNRIEVKAEGLREGEDVEVTIKSAPQQEARTHRDIVEFIQSLPPSSKSTQEWEEFEKEFQQERNSWDR
jgi:hypothetical protein